MIDEMMLPWWLFPAAVVLYVIIGFFFRWVIVGVYEQLAGSHAQYLKNKKPHLTDEEIAFQVDREEAEILALWPVIIVWLIFL